MTSHRSLSKNKPFFCESCKQYFESSYAELALLEFRCKKCGIEMLNERLKLGELMSGKHSKWIQATKPSLPSPNNVIKKSCSHGQLRLWLERNFRPEDIRKSSCILIANHRVDLVLGRKCCVFVLPSELPGDLRAGPQQGKVAILRIWQARMLTSLVMQSCRVKPWSKLVKKVVNPDLRRAFLSR